MNEYLKKSAKVVLGLFVAFLFLVFLGRLIDSSLLRWSPTQIVVVGWCVGASIFAWWLGAVSARLWLNIPPQGGIPICTRLTFAIPFWFGLVSVVIWFGLAPS